MLPEENSPTAAIRTLMWGFLSMETKKRSIPDLQATIENIGRNICSFRYRRYRKKLWFISATERRMTLSISMAG
jgi:hypothetical protein